MTNETRMKVLSKITFGLVFLFNCSSQVEQDEKNIKRTYYENGNTKAEATYNADSVKHGYGKLFYESGELRLHAKYVNGKKEGLEETYYRNGSLKYQVYYLNDHPVGERLDYYENGDLKHYSFYDPAGEPHFRRSYDEEGDFLSEQGSRNTNLVSVTITDNKFIVGDTLQVRVYAPQPPDVKIELKVLILDVNDETISDQQLILKNGRTTFLKTLENTGEFTFRIELIYSDAIQSEFETYENSFQFTVNEK